MAIEVNLDPALVWHLEAPQDMMDAALELEGKGYRGTVAWSHLNTGEVYWMMMVNHETLQMAEVQVRIGDYMMLSGGILRGLTAQEWEEIKP